MAAPRAGPWSRGSATRSPVDCPATMSHCSVASRCMPRGYLPGTGLPRTGLPRMGLLDSSHGRLLVGTGTHDSPRCAGIHTPYPYSHHPYPYSHYPYPYLSYPYPFSHHPYPYSHYPQLQGPRPQVAVRHVMCRPRRARHIAPGLAINRLAYDSSFSAVRAVVPEYSHPLWRLFVSLYSGYSTPI